MTVGTQAQPFGKLLDYEQFIDHQLERTRRRIKLTDVATACLILLVGFLGVLFLEVVGDHLFGMPYWLRSDDPADRDGGGDGVCRVARCSCRWSMRINGLYAAKTIEGSDPAFKNSLINYLELKRHRDQLPRAVLATLESRAVNDLTQVDVEAAVNQRRLMQMVYALSAVIVVFCLYWAVSPRSPFDSVRRAFLADVVRPTNTQLVNIKPGDNTDLSEIVAGQHVNFQVDVQGVRPEKVLLHHSVDGGKFFAIKELSPGKKMYDAWSFTLPNVQQSHGLLLHRRRRRVAALPPGRQARPDDRRDHPRPRVPRVHQDRAPEGYRGRRGRGDRGDQGHRPRHDQHAGQAGVDQLHARQEDSPSTMEVTESDPTQLTGTFTVTKSGTYRINFRTLKDQMNPSPVNYDIIAIPDKDPDRAVRPPRQADRHGPGQRQGRLRDGGLGRSCRQVRHVLRPARQGGADLRGRSGGPRAEARVPRDRHHRPGPAQGEGRATS